MRVGIMIERAGWRSFVAPDVQVGESFEGRKVVTAACDEALSAAAGLGLFDRIIEMHGGRVGSLPFRGPERGPRHDEA